MTKNVQIRQGDVLLVPVKSLPADATVDCKDPLGRAVLAYGETSGHAHMIELEDPKQVEYRGSPAGERFVKLLTKSLKANISHGNLTPDGIAPNTFDHSAILLRDGVLQQGFQVEDFGEEVRRVAD